MGALTYKIWDLTDDRPTGDSINHPDLGAVIAHICGRGTGKQSFSFMSSDPNVTSSPTSGGGDVINIPAFSAHHSTVTTAPTPSSVSEFIFSSAAAGDSEDQIAVDDRRDSWARSLRYTYLFSLLNQSIILLVSSFSAYSYRF